MCGNVCDDVTNFEVICFIKNTKTQNDIFFIIFLFIHSIYSNFIYLFKGDALRDLVPFLKLKKRENTHRGVMFFAELQAEAYNFTKRIFPPWELLTIFKLHKR